MTGLVMCGNHIAGEPVVRGLLQAGIRFDWFVCPAPDQHEQAQVAGYHDYAPLAEEHGIPLYRPHTFSLRSARDIAFFREHGFALLIQGGWQRLFPEEVLATLRFGAIGIHGSADYLPKGRGRSPMNWSLIEGRRRFVMQLFLIRAGIDDGDVIDAEMFDITPFDDIETLYYKYSIVSRDMHLRTIPKLLAGEVHARPQVGRPTYYRKRTPEDGEIEWEEMDVYEVYDFVRAQTRPYPGAFGTIDGAPYRIWRCRPFDTRLTYPNAGYGSIVERFGQHLIVNCRGGLLLLDDYELID